VFAITTRGEHDIPNGAGSLSSPWRRKATLCSRHDAGVVLAGATVEQGTSVAGDVAVGTASWCSRGGDRGVVVGARSCLAASASASGQGRRGRRARVAPWARLMPRCARRPRDSEQGRSGAEARRAADGSGAASWMELGGEGALAAASLLDVATVACPRSDGVVAAAGAGARARPTRRGRGLRTTASRGRGSAWRGRGGGSRAPGASRGARDG